MQKTEQWKTVEISMNYTKFSVFFTEDALVVPMPQKWWVMSGCVGTRCTDFVGGKEVEGDLAGALSSLAANTNIEAKEAILGSLPPHTQLCPWEFEDLRDLIKQYSTPTCVLV